MVIANCLYSIPVVPPMNAAGTNTLANTSTVAMIGPETSAMAVSVASIGFMAKSLILRSTFSTTTMASSTTNPIASTNPNNVRMLMEKSRSSIPINVPVKATTIAEQAIAVDLKLCRNR